MKRAMSLVTRVECNEESNRNEGGRQSTATRAMAMMMAKTWPMAMVKRLAGNEEGKGESVRAMAVVMRMMADKRAM